MKRSPSLQTAWSAGIKIALFAVCFAACQPHYTPKPRGYFRIIFPDKTYESYEPSGCPFRFSYPDYARIEPDRTDDAQPCWIDVVFPEFNARLHLSYIPVRDRAHFNELAEDARKFAYAHVVKATGIRQERIDRPQGDVYGLFYDIGGNVASATQFFVSDSTTHYIRGALYFNERPRADSIQPVVDFLRDDIDVLVRTMQWR